MLSVCIWGNLPQERQITTLRIYLQNNLFPLPLPHTNTSTDKKKCFFDSCASKNQPVYKLENAIALHFACWASIRHSLFVYQTDQTKEWLQCRTEQQVVFYYDWMNGSHFINKSSANRILFHYCRMCFIYW